MEKIIVGTVLILFVSGCYSSGTTRDLESIFIGRCHEFQRVSSPEDFQDSVKNCTFLWRLFHDAFAYKPPCNTTDEDYRNFCDAAVHELDPDRVMFWENVFPFVKHYSQGGQRCITMTHSLYGAMADDLSWCGQAEPPGVNYDNCPATCPDGSTAVNAYWAMTSTYFSQLSTGRTGVMLNGSVPVPFDQNTFFATYELVNLTPEKNVSHLEIVVVHNLGGPIVESCGEGTLLDLENQAISQGLTVTCVDDPKSVRHFQCVDNPAAEECISPQGYANKQ